MRSALRKRIITPPAKPITRPPGAQSVGRWRPTRCIASTSKLHDNRHQHTDALQGYPADLLDAPLRSIQHVIRTTPEPPPTDDLPMTEKEKTLAKARVVFGSRISGPEERQQELERNGQWIAGVLVPPKPEEPDNCCMSGCVNCVWELFREDLEEWAAKRTEARQKMISNRTSGQATGMMAQESGMPSHATVSMDDDGGGSETNWSTSPGVEEYHEAEDSTDPMAGIPVGIREFMKTEKKLKARHRAAGEVMDRALDKDLRASVWGSGR